LFFIVKGFYVCAKVAKKIGIAIKNSGIATKNNEKDTFLRK